MDLFEAIAARRSIRKYGEGKVDDDTIMKILDAGRLAPSAYGEEPWHFIVVKDKKQLKVIAEMTDHGKFIKGANFLIVVYCGDGKYYLEDGCAAVENILLAVAALKLGACWVAGDKKQYVDDMAKYFDVPEGYRLIALIPVGRPGQKPKKRQSKPLEEMVHWEKF